METESNVRNILLQGNWWLPSNPEDVQPGIAYWNDSGEIIIDFLDAFKQKDSDGKQVGFDAIADFPILFGESSTPTSKITLLNVQYSKTPYITTVKKKNFDHASAWTDTALIGAHIHNASPLMKSFHIEVNNLTQWCLPYSKVAYERNGEEVTVKSKLIDEVKTFKADLKDCSINLKIKRLTDTGFGARPFVIEPKAYFEIEFKASEKGTLDRIITISRMLCYFLNLATMKRIGILKIVLYPDVNDEDCYDNSTDSCRFHHLSLPNPPNRTPFISRSNVLFDISHIENRFNDSIKSWIDQYSRYQIVYDLFFSLEYASHTFPEQRFQHYIQALEGYQRIRNTKSKYVEKSQYRTWVRETAIPNISIPSTFPKEFADKIETSLKMANDYNLKERLQFILNRRQQAFTEWLLSDLVNRDKFLASLIATRNHYAHSLPKAETRQRIEPGTIEFDRSVARLRILVQACLLEIIGLRDEEIDSILRGKARLYGH